MKARKIGEERSVTEKIAAEKVEEAPAGGQAPDGEATHQREPLTRERVIRAALDLMDADGLEAVTMRRIGRELGVEAMSLYNHVKDKDDILLGVKELVMSEFEFGEPSDDWDQDARRGARAWRDLMRRHPKVITLMTEGDKPMVSLEALRPSESAFQLFRRVGLDDEETARAFCAFGGFILGFVLMEVGAMMGGSSDDPDAPRPEDLVRTLPADQLPLTCQVLPHLMSQDRDERFEYGLDLLLAGLKAKLDATKPA